MFENYVVFIQQYKNFSRENWVTSDRFNIPKSIIDFVATRPGKNLPVHQSVITSGGLVPPRNLHSCEQQDIGKLTDETKQILFKYDCDCVLLFENQLGAQDARDILASLWGIQLSPTSPPRALRYIVYQQLLLVIQVLQLRRRQRVYHFSNYFVVSTFLGFLELTKIDQKPPTLQCFRSKFWFTQNTKATNWYGRFDTHAKQHGDHKSLQRTQKKEIDTTLRELFEN